MRTPRTFSPTKANDFATCGQQFQWKHLDRLPEPETEHLALGNAVHEALEYLFYRHDNGDRTIHHALDYLEAARVRYDLSIESTRKALTLVENLWDLEDPNDVTVLGVEIGVEGEVNGVPVRGKIDRLRLDRGLLIAEDWKTGRAPRPQEERNKLQQLMLYSILLEQLIGRRPDKVRLVYLSKPVIIEATPDDATLRGLGIRTAAMWDAISRACESENFRPKPSALCSWCTWQAICPAWRDA